MYSFPKPPTLPPCCSEEIVRICNQKNHFLFDGKYYDQIDGVAMGSPLGPVLTNIFMCNFEEKWVMTRNIQLLIWFRYVDDTFSIFENKITANQFLPYLNSLHRNLKFTISLQKENFHWPVHKMGLIHSSQIQNKNMIGSFTYCYFRVCSPPVQITLIQSQWVAKASATKWLPSGSY